MQNCDLIRFKKNPEKQKTNNPKTTWILSGLNNSIKYIYLLKINISVKKFAVHKSVQLQWKKTSLNQAVILEE